MNIVDAFKRRSLIALVLFALFAGGQTFGICAQAAKSAGETAAAAGVSGGLCVQIGGGDTSFVADLAGTGRFLVHVLDGDTKRVEEARRRLSSQGLYGLVSVDRLDAGGKLPYTENLVNLLVILRKPKSGVSPDEIKRVLCPNGVVLAAPDAMSANGLDAAGLANVQEIQTGRKWLRGKKPWPAEMDQWSHPRHSASGNAVSGDTAVGPPRRVRWVVAAQSEVRGMVTTAGRNFYAGVLARDGFNGLRLWNRDLVSPSADGRFVMKNLPGNMPSPVSAGKVLFAVTQGKLLALDSRAGNTIREYTEAGRPRLLLHDDGVLIVADETSLRALDAETGRLLWNHKASDPRHVVAGDAYVGLIQGSARRGEKSELLVLEKATGKVRWKRDDFPWASKVSRCVYHQNMLAYEISSFNNDGPGNSMHVVSAADGKLQWERDFLPGMNHRRQARAMFLGDRLWILHGGRDAEEKKRPIQCSALDVLTGQVQKTFAAGLTHCFPPVATPRYLLAGELNLTDLNTGRLDANRITKAACSSSGGWVPANGLIYVTPKHCVCWPMLRGYAALAPQRPEGSVGNKKVEDLKFFLETGVDPPADDAPADEESSWPCYRHDAWRSGSTTVAGPSELNTLWSVDLAGSRTEGPIAQDWRENPFVKGPITSPVIAGGMTYIARPDAHEVMALDAASGEIRWRFTANGRVDTPPTIHRGLCLFGSKSGWVYCLRADDGRVVWKLRAAPLDERIVAYGQLESPHPVPGSVLVVDGTAFFAAGRQSFADGGILIFAVKPSTGTIRWVERLNTVPQQGFYESSGLEFDNFDLLHRQGDGVAMSRWVFDRATGKMSLDRWGAFAKLNTGRAAAMVPQGSWSYAPRHQKRIGSFTPRRSLVVFRDNLLLGSMQGMRTVYRRDFNLEGGETFDTKWMTGWAAGQADRQNKVAWRSQRLAEKAKWSVDVFDAKQNNQTIDAMVLAGEKLFLAGSGGELQVLSTTDGSVLAKADLPSPLWDGMAVADGRLFVSTAAGSLICLGEK